jgi:hypothetical protein
MKVAGSERADKLAFHKAVNEAYADTMDHFRRWSKEEGYESYVVPPATDPEPGFAIFYTPPVYRPPLLIVGQNPANFAGMQSLETEPNGTMLSGKPPEYNSYLEDDHAFALRIRKVFRGYESLRDAAVGMNVWHFQAKSKATSAPEPLLDFCQATTQRLVNMMKPKAILCFGDPAFKAISEGRKAVRLTGQVKEVALAESRLWGVCHLTAKYTQAQAAVDTPKALASIWKYLGNDD